MPSHVHTYGTVAVKILTAPLPLAEPNRKESATTKEPALDPGTARLGISRKRELPDTTALRTFVAERHLVN